MMQDITSLLSRETLARSDLIALLSLSRPEEIRTLHDYAYGVKCRCVGARVFLRGLIELSNLCEKNCFYCGIRRGNTAQQRYVMTREEILTTALWAHENGYGSVVLQSGERTDRCSVEAFEKLIGAINDTTGGTLSLTLSLGEQDRRTYARWRAAGAQRYLLRIETSNPDLYARLHPADHRFERRIECLHNLRDLGYQVGTGVMIGLPGQSIEDLADDILFFKHMDIDMIGMGPYVVHDETPLAAQAVQVDPSRSLALSLKMIALARIVLRDVNIAATTALQALHAVGREMGLQAGANVIMPNITDTRYRALYRLYNAKPCADESAAQCRDCLERRIGEINETIAYNEAGDPPHYRSRMRTIMNP